MADMAENKIKGEEDTLKDRYLTFAIENEIYGIEIKYVIEIVGIQKITKVPELPQYIKGIINLRGKIIPVMDVRLRFNKEPKEYNDRTCVVIINVKDISIGLIVDTVSDVITIPEQDAVEPPRINSDADNKYIKKIGKVGNDVRLLLDCEKLLYDDEIMTVSDAL